MKRIHVTVDEEALEKVQQLTGKKTYSDTINHLIIQAVKQDRLMKAIDDLSKGPDPWWPGYVEEQAPDVAEYLKRQKRMRRPAANTARAPVTKTLRRGSR
jgi:predicted CopG family antitoxin